MLRDSTYVDAKTPLRSTGCRLKSFYRPGIMMCAAEVPASMIHEPL